MTFYLFIPGNMFAQKWDSLIDIVFPEDETESSSEMRNVNPLVTELLTSRKGNATVLDMVETAEDFYISMGLHKLSFTYNILYLYVVC